MTEQILLYRTLGLGDFLTGIPAYRAVARACPAAQVFLATSPPLEPLVGLVGGLEFLPTEELHSPNWSGPPPDLAIDLHGRGPASHRVLLALRPRSLLAWNCPTAGVAGPEWS